MIVLLQFVYLIINHQLENQSYIVQIIVFFRHAFITNFITNNIKPDTTDAEIKEVSDRMGHSPEMFRGYKWIREGERGKFAAGGGE